MNKNIYIIKNIKYYDNNNYKECYMESFSRNWLKENAPNLKI